jgi:hypothetical protein
MRMRKETRNEKRETRSGEMRNEKRETRNEKRETRNEKRETRNEREVPLRIQQNYLCQFHRGDIAIPTKGVKEISLHMKVFLLISVKEKDKEEGKRKKRQEKGVRETGKRKKRVRETGKKEKESEI